MDKNRAQNLRCGRCLAGLDPFGAFFLASKRTSSLESGRIQACWATGSGIIILPRDQACGTSQAQLVVDKRRARCGVCEP